LISKGAGKPAPFLFQQCSVLPEDDPPRGDGKETEEPKSATLPRGADGSSLHDHGSRPSHARCRSQARPRWHPLRGRPKQARQYSVRVHKWGVLNIRQGKKIPGSGARTT